MVIEMLTYRQKKLPLYTIGIICYWLTILPELLTELSLAVLSPVMSARSFALLLLAFTLLLPLPLPPEDGSKIIC